MNRSLWPSSPFGRVAQATCWTRRDLINRSYSWFRTFPRGLRPDLLDAAAERAAAGTPLDSWAGVTVSPGLRAFARELRHELMERSGVVYLTGLPPAGAKLADDALRWCYLLIGTEIGVPMGPHGSLMDLGGPCGPAARPRGDAVPETSFHTDSAAAEVPDVVGMLCLQPPRSGGEHQIASAALAHELLKARCRELLHELYEPFMRADAEPRQPDEARPVFATSDQGRTLVFNYMRHRIEAAHEKTGVPLTPRQVSGFNRLDEALGEPVSHLRLQMKRGEILLINNRHIAHNRRSFVEHADPSHRRRMVRMWLSFPADAA
jgi:hypothetical protein